MYAVEQLLYSSVDVKKWSSNEFLGCGEVDGQRKDATVVNTDVAPRAAPKTGVPVKELAKDAATACGSHLQQYMYSVMHVTSRRTYPIQCRYC